MAFSPLEIPLGSLDTKTDERMLPNGSLLVAENCSAQTVGGYTKRNGYTQFVSGPSVLKLLGRGNQLAAMQAGGFTYLLDSNNSWQFLGGLFQVRAPDSVTTQSNIDLDQANDITIGTRCTCNGITVHMFVRGLAGSPTIWIRLVDVATGGILYENTVGTGVVTSMHSAAAGTNVVIFYSLASSLRAVKIDCAARTVGNPIVYQSGANVSSTLPVMDMCPLSTTDVLVAWYSDTPNVRVARFDTTTMATAAGPTVMSADVVNSGLAVIGTTGEMGAILYHSTAAGGIRSAQFNPATTVQTLAPFTVEAVTVPAGVNCGLRRFNATNVLAVWDRAATGITKQRVNWTLVDSTGALGGLVGPLYNAALASKPFAAGEQGNFAAINVWSPYDPQFTYFTVKIGTVNLGVNANVLPSAMHAYRTAYGVAPPLGMLYDVDTVASNSFAFAAPIAYKFLSTNTARAGWTSFGIEYRAVSMWNSVEALGDAVVTAGIVGRLDGKNWEEVNFSVHPFISQAVVGSVASGGMDNGTYSYIIVAEASDANGNTDRSTPSVAVTATTVAGAGLGKVTLTVDHLTLTRHGLVNTGCNLSVFRRLAAGAYRFVGSMLNGFGGGASQTYVDSANETTIQNNRLLYTNDSDAGTVIEREPPPAAYQLVLHKNRIWGISSADRKVVFYSGELQQGEAPWFSSLQQIRIDAGGDLNALMSMDDKLVAFKVDRVFKIYGKGLDGLGQTNDLSDPILITGDAGCEDFRSVVSANGGVYFMSAKGLYGLSRGEELSYAGESADKYWSSYANVVAATMMPDRQEIRFEVTGGTGGIVDALTGATIAAQKMVLNYVTNQWTTHRTYLDKTVVDARVVGGVYYWADSANVYKEDATTFLDPGSTFVRMLIRTGWIKPAGTQGWVRTQRAMHLGVRKTAHAFTMFCENDYVAGTTTATKTWTNAQLVTLPREQLNLHLVRQKGEAYRFTLYDGQDGAVGTGEGYSAFSLQLLAQALRGTFEKKLLAAARG